MMSIAPWRYTTSHAAGSRVSIGVQTDATHAALSEPLASALAATCAAPAPGFQHVAPAPVVTYTAHSPLFEYVAPAPDVTHADPTPVTECMASA